MSQTVVPFGFGVGDILKIAGLAIEVYQRVRDPGSEYGNLLAQTRQFSDLLGTLYAFAANMDLAEEQWVHIAHHTATSKRLLEDMKAKLDHHKSLGTNSRSIFQKLTWNKASLTEFSIRLTSEVAMLHALYFNVSQASLFAGQSEILDALHALKNKMRTGSAKLVSVSSLSGASNHDRAIVDSDWSTIIAELELLGITAAVAIDHKDAILHYFEMAVAFSQLPDDASSDTHSDHNDAIVDRTPEKVEAWLNIQDSLESLIAPKDDLELCKLSAKSDLPDYEPFGSLDSLACDFDVGQCHALEMGLLEKPQHQPIDVDGSHESFRQSRIYHARISIEFHFSGYQMSPGALKMIEDKLWREMEAPQALHLKNVTLETTVNPSSRLAHLHDTIQDSVQLMRGRSLVMCRYLMVLLRSRNKIFNNIWPPKAGKVIIHTHRMADKNSYFAMEGSKMRSMKPLAYIALLICIFCMIVTFAANVGLNSMIQMLDSGSTTKLVAVNHRLFIGFLGISLIVPMALFVSWKLGFAPRSRYKQQERHSLTQHGSGKANHFDN